MKHTETPWQVNFTAVQAKLESGEIVTIADCFSRISYECDQANAAHIVRCVNAYQELVDALELLMLNFVGNRSSENCAGNMGIAADKARAALAKSRA